MFRSGAPSRRESMRKSSVPDFIVCEELGTWHVHVPGAVSLSTAIPAETMQWMVKVEQEMPPVSIPTENSRMAPKKGPFSVPSGSAVSPTGYLFLRIVKTKLIGEEKSQQLMVRMGGDAVLSCPTGKSGTLQDYFLL